MSWTEERIEELARLWEAGHSASHIGKIMGVSKNAVVGKAHRLKLPARPSPIRGERPARPAPRPLPKPRPMLEVVPKAAPRPARRRNGAGGCLWPIGDPGDSDFHFCGELEQPGKPYCPEHCARAYIVKSRSGNSEAA